MKPLKFNVVTEIDHRNGRIMSVYFQLRKGQVADTQEVVEGKAFADYDKNGVLLGVELLAPCNATVFDRIADDTSTRTFLKRNIPKQSAWSPALAAS